MDVTSVPEYTADSTTVTFDEWTIDSLQLTADPDKIRNNGGVDLDDVSIITATYIDAGGETVTTASGADYAITFSITGGDGELSTTEAVEPVDGVATVELTATAAVDPADITVKAVGYESMEQTVIVGVAWGAIEVELFEGWNLISLPLIPDESGMLSIEDVLASGDIENIGIIRAYDASTGLFPYYIPSSGTGDLTEITDGFGYWMYMNEADVLTVYGREMPVPPEIPPSYSVIEGWNLIGFKSVEDDLTADYLVSITGTYPVIWRYDAATLEYANIINGNMTVGHGFWLWVTQDGVIVPPGTVE